MSEACSHDCGSCGADCASRSPQDLTLQPHKESCINKVVGVVSGKGGVGKSMVSSLLAVNLQRKGYQTGIMDADITGPSIPKALGITKHAVGTQDAIYPVVSSTGIQTMSVNLLLEDSNDPVIWRGPVIAGTVRQFWSDVVWKDVDYMVVDMPPGTGDVPLTVFQSIPLDGIVIVTSPQELVSMIVGKAVRMAQMMNVPILGIVENMSYVECPDCGKQIKIFGESHVEDVAKEYGIPVLAQIPINPEIAAASDTGTVEQLQGDWISGAVTAVEKL